MSSDDRVFASSTQLDAIPKLDSTNWAQFSLRADEWIYVSGYGDLVKADRAPAAKTAAETDEEYKLRIRPWEDRNERACWSIRTKLDKNSFAFVKGKPLLLKTWMQTLAVNCSLSGTGMIAELLHKFWNMRLQDYKDVQEYGNTFRQIDEDLQAINEKEGLSETHMLFKFMEGLDSSFDRHVADFKRNRVFVQPSADQPAATDANARLQVVSFSELVRATQTEEIGIKQRETAHIAHAATHVALAAGQRVVDWCDHCRRSGHLETGCFKKHEHLRPASWNKGKFKGKGGFKIKGKGNNDKGKQPGGNKRKRSGSVTSVISHLSAPAVLSTGTGIGMLSVSELKSGYLFDSACSNHCVWDRNSFIQYEATPPDTQIKGIDGILVTPIGKGIIRIPTPGIALHIKEVFHCPNMGANLISPGQLETAGFTLGYGTGKGRGEGFRMTLRGHSFTSTKRHNVYLLDLESSLKQTEKPVASVTPIEKTDLVAAVAYLIDRLSKT